MCGFCHEGFSIFSTDLKGNKNVIWVNISKSKNGIKNRGHGFKFLSLGVETHSWP